MAESYATVSELEARWRALSPAEQHRAEALLDDASAMLRATVRGLDAKLDDGRVDADVARVVVCGMVRRAMIAGAEQEGVSSAQDTTGPFTYQYSYSNPLGNLYVTKAEKGLLGVGAQRAFTIDPTPPAADGSDAPWWVA